MQFSQQPAGAPWGEMQVPMHLRLQSLNEETFVGAGTPACDLSMADISQQTLAMSAQLRQDSGDRLPDPCRVELPRRNDAAIAADKWLPQQVMHPTAAPSSNPLAGCVDAMELERLVRQQLEQGSHMAQATQILQNMQSQIGPFQEDFLQQTMHEIAKRCAAPEGLSGEWGAAAVAAMANGGLPPPQGTSGFGVPTPGQEQLGSWGNYGEPYGQVPLGGGAIAVSGSSAGVATGQGEEASFDRVEELNLYIRQQSQEYLEGQSEWSRQIAEVRSECLRDVERVRREKDEVERQARQELMRLNQRLRDLGVNDEGRVPSGGDSPSDRDSVGAWAAGVSLDEYNQVHAKWQAAEERIQQLEVYIKDMSAKNAAGGNQGNPEEIQTMRHVILQSGLELQQTKSELQALQIQHEQKNQSWEQGARRLLGVVEQFLGQCNEPSSTEPRCHENGHFANTATKVSLTLSKDKDGASVGSLRRLLKDALTQSTPSDGKEGRANKEKKASRRAKEEKGITKSAECDSSAASPEVTGNQAALSDSASSRDTSPGPGIQVGGSNGLCCGDSPQRPGAAVSLISQLASEMRQLLTANHQSGGPMVSPQALPSSASTATGSASPKGPSEAERTKVQDILDSMTPARKAVATNIIMVEKMLRFLEQDLRKQCQALLGNAVLGISSDTEEAVLLSLATGEAKIKAPLGEDEQALSVSALRCAQHRTSALLEQFVQLPQKLKAVFDLTKRLGLEVNSLVPISIVQQAEARASRARMVEQRQTFHVEVLQKRLVSLTSRVEELGGSADMEDEPKKEGDKSEVDAASVTEEIQQELQRGISQEDQLLLARTNLRRMSQKLASQGDRTKSLENEVVDLQLSRYNERAQCLALLQQSAGLQKAPAAWPWPQPPLGSMPDFASQAWAMQPPAATKVA